jgi:dihydroorotate dehydrogenase
MSIENGVELSALAVEKGASGIIATNTTTDYSLVETPAPFGGGLSGNVLRERSFTIFDEIAKELYGKAVLISVGGIDSGKEAYRRIQAGASLVQVYTALIYKGPSLVRKMNLELLKLLERDGFSNISEAIGSKR